MGVPKVSPCESLQGFLQLKRLPMTFFWKASSRSSFIFMDQTMFFLHLMRKKMVFLYGTSSQVEVVGVIIIVFLHFIMVLLLWWDKVFEKQELSGLGKAFVKYITISFLKYLLLRFCISILINWVFIFIACKCCCDSHPFSGFFFYWLNGYHKYLVMLCIPRIEGKGAIIMLSILVLYCSLYISQELEVIKWIVCCHSSNKLLGLLNRLSFHFCNSYF